MEEKENRRKEDPMKMDAALVDRAAEKAYDLLNSGKRRA